ncbi:HEPN domain-containing protein [Bradyrhizobium tropiciagri]|uniref:HEPN domain-containing protein n=1 Tax=Bradyrhizobium tropiciagri TaxID=312253 RepID=UPI00067A8491|nr:HEPN domain-containing protein [Bradyrhizobium tropiciagri]
MPETQTISLADVAKSFADSDPSFRYFHGKIFSVIIPDPEQFADLAANVGIRRQSFPNSHPATMLFGKLAPLVSNRIDVVMAVEDGRLKLHHHLSKAELPDCNYLALISPAERYDSETSYAKAFESISFLKAYLALPFGRLSSYSWVANFDFDENGIVSLSGPTIRMPLLSDLFRIVDPALMAEISGRLALQQTQYRTRLERACKFFDMALGEEDEAFKFSSYWIALEILVGGKSDAIRTKLSASYGQRNKSFADEKLLFKEIEAIRHGLFHKGSFHTLRSYQERLLQLFFWDIVIEQIGLKSRGLALALVESGLIEQEKGRSLGAAV